MGADVIPINCFVPSTLWRCLMYVCDRMLHLSELLKADKTTVAEGCRSFKSVALLPCLWTQKLANIGSSYAQIQDFWNFSWVDFWWTMAAVHKVFFRVSGVASSEWGGGFWDTTSLEQFSKKIWLAHAFTVLCYLLKIGFIFVWLVFCLYWKNKNLIWGDRSKEYTCG